MQEVQEIIQEALDCLALAKRRLAFQRLQGELCLDLEADIKALEADIKEAQERAAA